MNDDATREASIIFASLNVAVLFCFGTVEKREKKICRLRATQRRARLRTERWSASVRMPARMVKISSVVICKRKK